MNTRGHGAVVDFKRLQAGDHDDPDDDLRAGIAADIDEVMPTHDAPSAIHASPLDLTALYSEMPEEEPSAMVRSEEICWTPFKTDKAALGTGRGTGR